MERPFVPTGRALALFVLSFALASSACIFSPKDGGVTPVDPRLDRSTRDGTLEFYQSVWKGKLYERYEEVLHDRYEFFPLSEDADDFGWLPGDSWGRTVELGMASNMFDPNFSGQDPPVDSIEFELVKQDEDLLNEAEQRYLIRCRQFGSVMWTATSGKSFDTVITLELVPDPDQPELWQIVRQDEIPMS
jgi:hypothetical protein